MGQMGQNAGFQQQTPAGPMPGMGGFSAKAPMGRSSSLPLPMGGPAPGPSAGAPNIFGAGAGGLMPVLMQLLQQRAQQPPLPTGPQEMRPVTGTPPAALSVPPPPPGSPTPGFLDFTPAGAFPGPMGGGGMAPGNLTTDLSGMGGGRMSLIDRFNNRLV